jgi:hypothetical protein
VKLGTLRLDSVNVVGRHFLTLALLLAIGIIASTVQISIGPAWFSGGIFA